MRDSTFDQFLPRHIFRGERAIIPRALVERKMAKIEQKAESEMMKIINKEFERILEQADRALDNNDLSTLLSLDWNIGVSLQKAIFDLWESAWGLGESHGLESQRNTVPPTLKNAALTERYSMFAEIDPALIGSIRNLFNVKPTGIQNTPAEQAVLRRVINLAGNYSDDVIKKLKGDLISAILPQEKTGAPISRKELVEKIQGTLNTTKARATTIARTETTNAYNQGRMETYARSNLVTHVRFLAISDDRTTDICLSRNGMVMPLSDPALVTENTPPLHFNCRSVLSPLMPSVSRAHAEMVNDPARQPDDRKLTPLPAGWGSGDSTVSAAPVEPIEEKVDQPVEIVEEVIEQPIQEVTEENTNPSLKDSVMDFDIASEKENLATMKASDTGFGDPKYDIKNFVEYNEAKILVEGNNPEAIPSNKKDIQNAIRSGLVPHDSLLGDIKLTKADQKLLAENKIKLADAKKQIEEAEKILDKKSVSDPSKWKPTMTREEADAYFGDNNYFGTQSFWHGNSKSVTESIRTEGAQPERNKRGAYGKGVYAGSSKAIGLTYGNPHTGDTELLEMRIFSKNPYIVDSAKMKELTEDALEVNGYSNDLRVLMKANGYDSIYVKDIGYIVALDKEQVVVVDSAKPSKKDATGIEYNNLEGNIVSKFQNDMAKLESSPRDFGMDLINHFESEDDFF